MSTAYYWKSGNENRCKQAEKERERERERESEREGDGERQNWEKHWEKRKCQGKERLERGINEWTIKGGKGERVNPKRGVLHLHRGELFFSFKGCRWCSRNSHNQDYFPHSDQFGRQQVSEQKWQADRPLTRAADSIRMSDKWQAKQPQH